MYLFFQYTVTFSTYSLSLHDALPICLSVPEAVAGLARTGPSVLRADFARLTRDARLVGFDTALAAMRDRKSTRLNSSHEWISYAVFCLKKKRIILMEL